MICHYSNALHYFTISGKTVTALYILQLAIADSIFLLTLPIFAAQKVAMHWAFGRSKCNMGSFADKSFSSFVLLKSWIVCHREATGLNSASFQPSIAYLHIETSGDAYPNFNDFHLVWVSG